MLFIKLITCLFFVMVGLCSLEAQPPNIVFILTDDLGYGDLSCYNSESKIKTQHLDQMAAEGLRFTDAHSPSTVCTPSRYSLLTGRMAFRTGFKGVFGGIGGPCMIEKGRLTLQEMLQQKGYATACFGKWHMGMTFFDKKDGSEVEPIRGIETVKKIDFTRFIPDAPIHHGFDHFFGTVSCPTTSWMYAYVDGDRVPVPPDLNRIRDDQALPSHPYSHDCRAGLQAPDFEFEQVDMKFLEKSQAFLKQHVETHPKQPFFLFHSMQAVHLPSFPAPQFKGKSGAGPHGDFIYQLDHIVGELLKTLKELKVDETTLVMFSSDNGPEVPTSIAMRRDHQHNGARPWRGVKRDNWEGGHRVPMIARWPSVIKAGRLTDQPFCLTDVLATCASLVDADLSEHVVEDSFDFSELLKSEKQELEPIRPYLIHQTISLALSIRKGDWKYLDHKGSGGNGYNKDRLKPLDVEASHQDLPAQLYNLKRDPGERNNVINKYPEIAKALKQALEEIKNKKTTSL